jgi:hypothetical protein
MTADIYKAGFASGALILPGNLIVQTFGANPFLRIESLSGRSNYDTSISYHFEARSRD